MFRQADGPADLTCEGCGVKFVPAGKRGPLPTYCSGPCRQAAYRRRVDPRVGTPEAAAARAEGLAQARDRQSIGAGLRHAGLLADGSAPVASRGSKGWINGTGADLDVLSPDRSWWPTFPEDLFPTWDDSDRPGVGETWRSVARTYLDGRLRVPAKSFGALDQRVTPPADTNLNRYLSEVLHANPLETQAASAALPSSMRYVQGDNLTARWHFDGTPVGATPDQKIDAAIRRLFLQEEVFEPIVGSKKEDTDMSVITDAELHERLTQVETGLQQALRDLVVTAALLSQRLPADKRQTFADNVVPILSRRVGAAS